MLLCGPEGLLTCLGLEELVPGFVIFDVGSSPRTKGTKYVMPSSWVVQRVETLTDLFEAINRLRFDIIIIDGRWFNNLCFSRDVNLYRAYGRIRKRVGIKGKSKTALVTCCDKGFAGMRRLAGIPSEEDGYVVTGDSGKFDVSAWNEIAAQFRWQRPRVSRL